MKAWGWGAIAVDTPPAGWSCPLCGWRAKGRESPIGRHFYPFSAVCTRCARSAFLAELLARAG